MVGWNDNHGAGRVDRRPVGGRRAGAPSHELAGGLSAWVAQLLVDDAARERAQRYWLRRQAEEEGTFAGVLADLAERSTPVVVQVTNGRRHGGIVTAIGGDFAVVRSGARDVMVRLAAIGAIRTLPRARVTAGDRPAAGAITLAEALGALAEQRVRVLLVGADADDATTGELRAVGRDVVQVRVDGGGSAYVALASVLEVSAAESG